MSMKLKIGFTIPAETLFGLVAKFLPIEDLSVEEILERPMVKESKVAQLVAQIQPKLTKEKIPHKPHNPFRHSSGKPLVFFVEEYLNKYSTRPVMWAELSKLATELGFSKSSINNAISRLQERKIMERTGNGKYRLVEKKAHKSA
jgi:hypothetical protein